MDELTGVQRRKLKSLAHDLRPVVQIGKQGLSASIIAATNEALEVHELIKVKFLDYQDEQRTLAGELAQATGSQLVFVIGHIAILYRRQPDPALRKVHLTV
jgi:RNA-binding protein